MSKKSDRITPEIRKIKERYPTDRSSVPYIPEENFPSSTEESEPSASGPSEEGSSSAQDDTSSGDNTE